MSNGLIDNLLGDIDYLESKEHKLNRPVIRAYHTNSTTYQDYQIRDYNDIGHAINEASSDGAAKIELPAGEYAHDTTINPAGPLRLVGQSSITGNPITRLQYNGTANAFEETTNDYNLEIAHTWFRGPGTSGSAKGIRATGRITLNRIKVANFDIGTHLTNVAKPYKYAYASDFNNCRIGLKGEFNAGHFVNCRFSSNSDYGANPTNWNSLSFRGCSMESNGHTGVYANSSVNNPEQISIRDCYVEGNTGNGIVIAGTSTGDAFHVSVRDNYLRTKDGANAALRLAYVNRGVVENNEVYAPGSTGSKWGIEDRSTVSELVVRQNKFRGTFGNGEIRRDQTRGIYGAFSPNGGNPSAGSGVWSGMSDTAYDMGVTVLDTTNGNVYAPLPPAQTNNWLEVTATGV